jgi:hypothetical protein
MHDRYMSFSTFFRAASLILLVAGCDDETPAQGGQSPGGSPPTPGGNGGDGGIANNGGNPSNGGNGDGSSSNDGGFGGTTLIGSGGAGGEPMGGGDSFQPNGDPPDPPINAPAGDGSAPRIFAVDHLFIGTKDFSGLETVDAWESYGYDVDQTFTISDFSAHCTPAGGAAPNNVFPDANDGIDNSFGKSVVPILKTAAATTTADLDDAINEPIVAGDYTLVFDISSLGPATDYSPLPSSYFEGRDEQAGTWLKAPESFSAGTPLLAFPDGYSSTDVWVSQRVDGVLPVRLIIADQPFVLQIHRPLISAEMSADHDSVIHGIISGVLDTQEMLDSMEAVLGGIEPSFCDGAAIEGILNQIRQASDIMNDGTQAAGEECNGISIGLGFTATAVTAGGFGNALPPPVPPCP